MTNVLIHDIAMPARDGYSLAATLHRPAHTSSAAVLINSGTGIRRGYYHKFARFLAENGCTVLTYDYRGIGGSRPRTLRGFNARMRDWAQLDMASAAEWCVRELQPDKFFVLGHSAGGQLVGLAGIHHLVQGLVLVAAQSGYWRYWPARAHYRYALMWRLLPLVTGAVGYLPGKLGIGEDLPRGVANEWAQWCRHPRYLLGCVAEHEQQHYHKLSVPLLAYSFWDDDYAPKLAVEALLREYASAKLTHIHFTANNSPAARIGHFGFFREQFRASLWQETLVWLSRI